METKKISDLATDGQVRQELGDITELTASIKEHGIIVPLIIDKKGTVIAGHRRLAAAKAAGLTEVPVTVSDTTDKTAVQIIENTQREGLKLLEEAQAYKQYMKEHKCEVNTLAKVISKPSNYILRRIAALSLIAAAQEALAKGKIEIGHAELLGQMTEEQQKISLKEIQSYDLTVQNFSDQIRWMRKIDFGNLKFRVDKQRGQRTLLGVSSEELNPEHRASMHDLTRSPAFKKELAVYVEEKRKLLREKGIPVFSSEEDLMKKHPNAQKVPPYETSYTKVVKSLPGSKTHAVVVDLEYNDIDIDIFVLEKPKEKHVPEADKDYVAKDYVGSKADQEDAEKTLQLSRREKLKSRTEHYKRELYLKEVEARLEEGSHHMRVMTAWALMQPQKAGWALDIEVETMLKELGCKKKGTDYSRTWLEVLQTLDKMKDAALDSWIKKLSALKFDQLSEEELEYAKDMVGFKLKTDWQIDEAFLEMHSKEQLLKLVKELGLAEIAEGSKGDMIKEILKQKLKGKVPKVMEK